MRNSRRSLLALLALLALVGAVWLYVVVTAPQQRTLDQRVDDVASQLKCPVCQHESVADSSSSRAQEMRLVIRQQLQSGRSEQQVLNYFADHYGNGILLTPPQQGFHLLAWLIPVAMLLLGLGLVSFVVRDWSLKGGARPAPIDSPAGEASLDDTELEGYRAQLERELAEDDLLFG